MITLWCKHVILQIDDACNFKMDAPKGSVEYPYAIASWAKRGSVCATRYVNVDAPFDDAFIAGLLCDEGPIAYGSEVADEWLFEHVLPNIQSGYDYDHQLCRVLVLSMLWGSFESECHVAMKLTWTVYLQHIWPWLPWFSTRWGLQSSAEGSIADHEQQWPSVDRQDMRDAGNTTTTNNTRTSPTDTQGLCQLYGETPLEASQYQRKWPTN
jgi:hypothetical protein